MIRFDIALLALALAATSVACGGSDTPPAKDPSSDPAATLPADPAATPAPPPPASAQPPALGLGGTGTPAGPGAGQAH